MNSNILADAEALTMVILRERVQQHAPRHAHHSDRPYTSAAFTARQKVLSAKRRVTTTDPRHSFEDAMQARALIADRQAAKEQGR